MDRGIKSLPVVWVHVPLHSKIYPLFGDGISVVHIYIPVFAIGLVSCSFSTIPICPFCY